MNISEKICIFICLLGLLLAGCSSEFEWVVGAESILPRQLQQMSISDSKYRIINVGPRENYLAAHISGSRWIDYAGLEEELRRSDFDRRGPLVLTCPMGHLAALAVAKAKGQGFSNVFSLHGGIEAWQQSGFPIAKGAAADNPMKPQPPLLTPISPIQQWATMISGLVFKPLYMFLTLVLILGLRPSADRDITLLRRGLIVFLIGESFCALNYLIFAGGNDLFDSLHGLGMVLMGMLVSWGLAAMLDERIIGLTAPKSACAFKQLCPACWKHKNTVCLLQQLLSILAPALAGLALMPWCAELRSLHQISRVFETEVLYSYSIELQLVDFRLYPLLALIVFLLAWVILLRGAASLRPAQFFFFLGIGLLSFSLFRFLLLEAFRTTPPWMDFWEEITELFLITGLARFIYLCRKAVGFRLPWLR